MKVENKDVYDSKAETTQIVRKIDSNFKFCDGKLDCSDGSDEHAMCHVEDPTTADKCEYGAAMTMDGIKCYCPGNKILNEKGKCEFLDYCAKVKNGENQEK